MARSWIVAGFAIQALGTVVNTVVLIHNGYLGHANAAADIQLFTQLVSGIALFLSWWLLSQVAAAPGHAPTLRRAHVAFSVWSLANALVVATYIWVNPHLSLNTSATWIGGLGSLGAAVGFALMARQLPGADRPDAED